MTQPSIHGMCVNFNFCAIFFLYFRTCTVLYEKKWTVETFSGISKLCEQTES